MCVLEMMSHNLHYNWFLKHVAIPGVSNSTTYGSDLQKFGRTLFGKKFHGIYMRDEIPATFSKRRPYGIINLDESTDPNGGSHWIAVAWKSPRTLLVYDSFGKLHQTPKELTNIYGRSKVTNPDAEQKRSETNCGARCLAWLLVNECFPKEAHLV